MLFKIMREVFDIDKLCKRAGSTYVWKHTTKYDRFNEIDKDALIFIMARNPLSWFRSIQKAPYQIGLERSNKHILDKKIRQRKIAEETEKGGMIGDYDNIMELWNHYNKIYKRLEDDRPNKVVFVKYEDMIFDPVGTIKSLARLIPFKEHINDRNLQPILMKIMKTPAKTHGKSHNRRKALKINTNAYLASKYKQDEIERIKTSIDSSAIKRLNYNIDLKKSSFSLTIEKLQKKISGVTTKNSYTNTYKIKPIKKYAFVFVCQQGRLEQEALFLAASLKRYLKCDYELIAAIPTPESVMGYPSDITIKLLKKMGVRIERMSNELVEKEPNLDFNTYQNKTLLFANKIFCFNIPTFADKLVFLDSDMILNEEFSGDISLSIPFNARSAGVTDSIVADGSWDKLFELVGAKMPLLRMKRTNKEDSSDSYFSPPHFNAGFIGINTEISKAFFNTWLKCYKKILSANLIANPILTEQVALALTVHKMEIPYNILNNDCSVLAFYHYFSKAEKILKRPKVHKLFQSILEEYPEMKDLIRDNKDWEFLFDLGLKTHVPSTRPYSNTLYK